MNYSLESRPPEKQKSDCIVLPLFENCELSFDAKFVNDTESGIIQKLLDRNDFKADVGATMLLPGELGNHTRLLLLGLGKSDEFKGSTLDKAIRAAINRVKTTAVKRLLVSLNGIKIADKSAADSARHAIEAIGNALYTFDDFRSKKTDKSALKEVAFYCGEHATPSDFERAISEGKAIAAGVTVAKNLGNLPGNTCTPSYLAKIAEKLAKNSRSISATVLDEKKMASLGMNSLLSVSKGSAEPARLIVLEYNGGTASEKPHILVGKGITFDSGGVSLKPGEGMDEMKYDMCGAASVLGTMTAIAELEPKLNIVAIIAAAENMPDGKASKPGDIVKTLSGQTVEILNTDAEGRLVLCDALTYAEQNFKPASIVDIATLTGACIIALGHQATGLLSNNDDLAEELLTAGVNAEDKAWRLPLWEEYQTQLDSNFADMQNIGGRPAGTITAACFLSRFTKKQNWAHLDIAGTAWVSGKSKGATGRPVPLLTRYLLNKAK